MSEKQNQYKSKHGPKINLPSSVKIAFMGKGNGEFRRMWANAISYSNDGWKKVATADVSRAKSKSRDTAADDITAAIKAK